MAKERKTEQSIRAVSWEEYELLLEKLSSKISNDIPSNFQQLIYGIPRGGLIVATCMTHINEKTILWMEPPFTKIICATNCIYIVVDDIVDSGKTAEEYFNKPNIVVASLFCREGASFEPHYYAEKLDSDVWIKFPWERSI